MVALGYVAILAAIVIAFHIVTVWQMGRLLQAKHVGPGRVTALVLGLVAGTIALQAISFYTLPLDRAGPAIVAEAFGMCGLAFFLYHWVLGLSWWNAAVTWLAAWGVYVAVVMALGVPTQMFVAEAYKVSTNSMAPSLLGVSRFSKCPHCNGRAVVSDRDLQDYESSGSPADMEFDAICRDCLQTSRVPVPVNSTRISGDRLLVDKTAKPQRWDIVMFHPPGEVQSLFAHRLVALPGETISIRSGKLWIDEELAQPPSDIAPLVYECIDWMEYLQHDHESYTLGKDEYFVLGDNSPTAKDSRDFGPILCDSVTGVVTVIYWPPERWRVFR